MFRICINIILQIIVWLYWPAFLHIFMPPFKEGRAYCFAAVCRLVCRSVGRSISSFWSFSLHWLHILKWNLIYRFIIRISRSSSALDTIEPFWQRYAPWTLKNSNNLQFLFIFFSLVAHIEVKFGIQIYHKNISVKLCFWVRSSHFWQSYAPWTLIKKNLTVMPLGLWKIPIICSFCSFSLHWLHILKWNFVYRFITRISRSSSVFGYDQAILTAVACCILNILDAMALENMKKKKILKILNQNMATSIVV
jgi:hypothetical protein